MSDRLFESVLTDADRAKSEEEFSKRHRAQDRIPGDSSFGDKIAFGQRVVCDFKFSDESSPHAKRANLPNLAEARRLPRSQGE